MSDLHTALMNKNGISFSEASEMIKEMKQRIFNYGEDPEEVLFEEGLEPDYFFDLV